MACALRPTVPFELIETSQAKINGAELTWNTASLDKPFGINENTIASFAQKTTEHGFNYNYSCL